MMDGTPNGRIKCTMDNWHGVAFRIPRTDLSKCESRDETGKMKTTAFWKENDRFQIQNDRFLKIKKWRIKNDRFWLQPEKRSFSWKKPSFWKQSKKGKSRGQTARYTFLKAFLGPDPAIPLWGEETVHWRIQSVWNMGKQFDAYVLVAWLVTAICNITRKAPGRSALFLFEYEWYAFPLKIQVHHQRYF